VTTDLAKSILESLDADQAEAASALKGPVCIVAGPGSGKTRTITHRIAYGVATGVYNPDRVLALTYTNRAAAEVRSRLRQLGSSTVAVRTFHSAALSQLQYFWPQLTGTAAPKLLTSKRSLVAEVANLVGLKLTDAQVMEIVSEIEYLRYSLTDVEDYFALNRLPSFLSQEKFAEINSRYQEQKLHRRLMDWEDTLLLCTGLLRNEARALSHFQQQFRFFTVDEYQDISPLQEGLLRTWLGEREEICVVGDPRQTIYSFAGASSNFLLGFQNQYSNASVFELNRNYRSGKEIVHLANRVLSDNPLKSIRANKGKTSLTSYQSASDEISRVSSEISRALASEKPSSIAVLARTNQQLGGFESELSRLGIRFQVRGQGRFFRQPVVMQAMSAIRALTVTELSEPLFIAVSKILSSLGWTSQPKQDDNWQALNWFIQILDELQEPTLAEYIRELDERERSGHEPTKDAVTLATVHGTKGLEWKLVFLVGLNRGLFPISHATEQTDMDEERRLFYVAITRAKDALHLSSYSEASEFLAGLDIHN
jgi:DNA helicase-2/ATP-dependent DNA helicase PcrA